jgi:hypothetical protein
MATAPSVTDDQVGIVEDVSDIIGLISPWDTPLYSAAGKRSAHNTLVEWQEDSLRAPAAAPATEGKETVIEDWEPTVMVTNRTQIFEASAQVSGTSQAVDLYGRANEMDWQVMKKGREQRRDVEYAFVGTLQTAVSPSDNTTARQLAGAQALISADTTDENSGTPRDFDESQVLAVHQACYEQGGDPDTLLVDPGKSVMVADFAYRSNGTIAERQRDMGGSTELVNVVERYRSPFGTLDVVIDRWISTTTVLLLEMPRWSVPVLRPMSSMPLAKTGDSEKRLIITELTLAVENGASSGLIADLN